MTFLLSLRQDRQRTLARAWYVPGEREVLRCLSAEARVRPLSGDMAEEEQLLADARQSTSEETSPSGRSRRLAWAAVPLALLAVGGLATNQAAKRTEQALPPEPQVHRIPDFGLDTQAVESILARVGCYYENDLDRLSVNYQG